MILSNVPDITKAEVEDYSIERFERMVHLAKEAEQKRIEESARVDHSISLDFPVALWRTERITVLDSLGKVIDILLTLDGDGGRFTGIFKATVELPDRRTDDTRTGN